MANVCKGKNKHVDAALYLNKIEQKNNLIKTSSTESNLNQNKEENSIVGQNSRLSKLGDESKVNDKSNKAFHVTTLEEVNEK